MKCPKSDDGSPAPHKELSDKNYQAWRFYMECKAVGQFPDDPIVRRNASLIRWIEDSADRQNAKLIPALLATFFAGNVRGKK